MLRIDDIKIKYKINIISFTNMFLFIIITIVLYYAMNNIKNINEENYTMSRLSQQFFPVWNKDFKFQML